MVVCFVNYNFPEGSINCFIIPLISIFLQQREESLRREESFSLENVTMALDTETRCTKKVIKSLKCNFPYKRLQEPQD